MIVYRARVFAVEVNERTFPDGRVRRVEIVRHVPSVVLMPIEDDGRIVLIKQYRAPADQELWEFPAGGIEKGESEEQAARRECEEEIGRTPRRLQRLQSFYPAPGFCDELLIFYRATGLRPPAPDSPHKPDEDERIETMSTTVAEARAMVERGEIVDLKTAYALTLL
jgi:ADP-ribose pyrophosphatase